MDNLEPILEKKRKPPLLIYLVGFFIFLFGVLYYFLVSPPKEFNTSEIFSVETGDSLRKISFKLKEAGYIKSRVLFETWVIFLGGEKKLVVGDYIFGEKVGVFTMAKKIATGDRQLGLIKITIPEGFNNHEIAEVCDLKLRNFDKSRFLSLASEDIGYLFPDTYFFSTTDDESVVLKMMTKNFERKTAVLLEEIRVSGKSFKDIIIMASILEEEANGEEDRALISGILWNRLKINMPLQVDAVPITYKERGLPKAPVSNPGLAAITASFKPENSKYLYYLHDKTGKIYFAKTYDEHRQNIRKYLR